MRLKVFGIPKILLVLIGLLPTALWCIFHLNLLSYHERSAPTIVAAGFALSLIFTYFFSRGLFAFRFVVLLCAGVVFGDAFISAMIERDFLKLAFALAAFGATVFLFFWVEARVQGADVNPKLKWFEGKPKFLPELEARLKIGDSWVSGQVRAIDRRGFFVFLADSITKPTQSTISFALSFKNSEVEGQSKLSAQFFGETAGFGLQFLPKDLYHFSQYTALVERLRGEGL